LVGRIPDAYGTQVPLGHGNPSSGRPVPGVSPVPTLQSPMEQQNCVWLSSDTESSCSDWELDRESSEEADPTTTSRPQTESTTSKPQTEYEEKCNQISSASVLSQLEVVRRRKARINSLLGLYKKQYWNLCERLRTKHRRFFLRRARAGWKQQPSAIPPPSMATPPPQVPGAAPVLVLPDGTAQVEGNLAACHVDTCTAGALPMAPYCLKHILLDEYQCLYVPDEEGNPVRRTAPPEPIPRPSQVL